MSMGINNAGPTGAPVFGNQGPAAAPVAGGDVLGQAGNPSPNGATPYFNASFESLMAAVSRGEVPLNVQVATGGPFGGVAPQNGQQANPTLMQAISQGIPQNATNGIGVVSGYGVGAGNGGAAPAQISGTGGLGSPTVDASDSGSATSFGGALAVDSKQMVSATTQIATPVAYGGN
jgi:hypothetical protein